MSVPVRPEIEGFPSEVDATDDGDEDGGVDVNGTNEDVSDDDVELDVTDVDDNVEVDRTDVAVEATVIPGDACTVVTPDVKGTEVAIAEVVFDTDEAKTDRVGVPAGGVEVAGTLPVTFLTAFCTSASILSISLFLF